MGGFSGGHTGTVGGEGEGVPGRYTEAPGEGGQALRCGNISQWDWNPEGVEAGGMDFLAMPRDLLLAFHVGNQGACLVVSENKWNGAGTQDTQEGVCLSWLGDGRVQTRWWPWSLQFANSGGTFNCTHAAVRERPCRGEAAMLGLVGRALPNGAGGWPFWAKQRRREGCWEEKCVCLAVTVSQTSASRSSVSLGQLRPALLHKFSFSANGMVLA